MSKLFQCQQTIAERNVNESYSQCKIYICQYFRGILNGTFFNYILDIINNILIGVCTSRWHRINLTYAQKDDQEAAREAGSLAIAD